MTVTSGTQTIAQRRVQISGGSLAVAISGGGVLAINGNITDDNGQEALTLARRRHRPVDPQRQPTPTAAGRTCSPARWSCIRRRPAGRVELERGGGRRGDLRLGDGGRRGVPAPVPEPGTLALLLVALGGAAIYGRSRRRSKDFGGVTLQRSAGPWHQANGPCGRKQ